MIILLGKFLVIKPNQYNPLKRTLDEQMCKILILFVFISCHGSLSSYEFSSVQSDLGRTLLWPPIINRTRCWLNNSKIQERTHGKLSTHLFSIAWYITMYYVCVWKGMHLWNISHSRGWVASARSVSIVIEMILTAGAHQQRPLWLTHS